MNGLPVGPHKVSDSQSRNQYFDDLERWGFDIAYNAYYAFKYDDLVGKFKESYVEFVKEAHRRGFPACIQIQSTVCAGDRVGISEAQYHLDNTPDKWSETGFFASFASEAWKDYLKELTTLFVNDYGYDYVVYEEPMFRVDIPGTKDRFYERFIKEYPDVKYPESRKETAEYLKLQEAKADILVSFYRDLAKHAKSCGAKKVGIMPWFFIPTIENTPQGTLNTSCPINRLAGIPEVDIIVVRMQPDNIYCDTMRTGDDKTRSPELYYAEVMAHELGKDVIAVNNPTDEHTDYPACPLIPLDFYKDATISALAAAPCGFTRHWYGQNYEKDSAHMDILVEAMKYASRLGRPISPIAFVFSYSGTRHAEPYTYETVFQFYWALVKHLSYKAHMPILTFFADTLEEDLARHPEVQVLVFEEHFPLTVEQMSVIRNWWQGTTRRAVIAFGSGLGFSSDISSPGLQPCVQSFPGVLDLIGLRQDSTPQLHFKDEVRIKDTARIRRSAFLGDELTLKINAVANVRRIFGARANVLYEVDTSDGPVALVAEWRDRNTLAMFCGFGLNDNTAEAAEKAIRYALHEVDCPKSIVDECDDGILWNINANGYLVFSNISDAASKVKIKPVRTNLWDCAAQRLLPCDQAEIDVEPHSFRVFRVVGKRSKFLDILGASYLRRLTDGAGRAELELIAGRKTILVLKSPPKEILVDGKPSAIEYEIINNNYHVLINQCQPGERVIELKW